MMIKPRLYGVDSIQWPYMGGEGFIAGLPVLCIRFDSSGKGGKFTSDQLVAQVLAELPEERLLRPRWIAMINGDGIADNDLLVQLRIKVGLLTYFETKGTASMCDSSELGGRLAMYDHVCVRVELPLKRWYTDLWHSVVVSGGDYSKLGALSFMLDKFAFNGPRFVSKPKGSLPSDLISKLCHSSWRVTQPVC